MMRGKQPVRIANVTGSKYTMRRAAAVLKRLIVWILIVCFDSLPLSDWPRPVFPAVSFLLAHYLAFFMLDTKRGCVFGGDWRPC